MSAFLTKWASEPEPNLSPMPVDSGMAAVMAPTMNAPEHGMSWAEWKAAALNGLFREHGVTGQPGRITAGTVRHSERKAGAI